jgi:hypothetical protein
VVHRASSPLSKHRLIRSCSLTMPRNDPSWPRTASAVARRSRMHLAASNTLLVMRIVRDDIFRPQASLSSSSAAGFAAKLIRQNGWQGISVTSGTHNPWSDRTFAI